jgi:hypothetical protein
LPALAWSPGRIEQRRKAKKTEKARRKAEAASCRVNCFQSIIGDDMKISKLAVAYQKDNLTIQWVDKRADIP